MRKIDCTNESCEGALQSSLSAIRRAHLQLHLLTGKCTTATAIASRIELCDFLLVQISGIRSSLANDLRHARGALNA